MQARRSAAALRTEAIAVLAAAALGAVALAGCGTSGTKASSETSHSKAQGSTAFNQAALGQLQAKITAALKGKDLSRVKIAMVTNSTSDYWKEAQAGWNKAIADLHVQAVFQQPTQSQASLQVSILQIALGLVLGVAIVADRIRTRHQGRARPPRLPQFSAVGLSPPPVGTR